MTQHDHNIANAPGATVRADVNALAEAIASLNSGPSAPPVTFSNMLWFDTTAGILKKRNNANTAWEVLSDLMLAPFFNIALGMGDPAKAIARANIDAPSVTDLSDGLDGKSDTGHDHDLVYARLAALNIFTKPGRQKVTVLNTSGSIAVDLQAGAVFYVGLTGNGTLANPSNFPAADEIQEVMFIVQQTGGGGHTLGFGSAYRIKDESYFDIETADGSLSIIPGFAYGSELILTGLVGF